MKGLSRIITSVIVIGILCLCIVSVSFGATKTSDKDYMPKNVKINYQEYKQDDGGEKKKVANVLVTWDDTNKSSSKVVRVTFNGTEIVNEEVDANVYSYDLREDVLKHGAGKYVAYVYSTKSGRGDNDKYVVSSSTGGTKAQISSKKIELINGFDPDEFAIDGPEIYYNKDKQHVEANWDEGDSVKSTKICIKKGKTVVYSWQRTTDNPVNISEVIAEKGSGNYTIGVCSTALGDCNAVYSDECEISDETAKAVKKTVQAEQEAIEKTRIGWYRNGTGSIWYYYKDYGVKAKNEWVTVNGKTYHFTNAGIMQTGWQIIDKKYYYFAKDGSLVRNAKTPDGYQTNENGERIDSNGNIISAEGMKQAPASETTLKTCTITVSETSEEPGIVKNASFKDGTGYVVKKCTFEKPYEQWSPGRGVKVSMTVEAATNYLFGSGMTFTVRGASNVKSSGTATVKNLTFTYYPKMQLPQPTYIHFEDDYVMTWKKVEYADRYKIVIEDTENDVKVTEEITATKYDLSSYADESGDAVKVTITAYANKSKSKYISQSKVFQIDNMYEYALNNYITGNLTFPSGRVKYIDEDGEKGTGWICLLGNWYHFKKSGIAESPGWFKDTDGNWYYFDDECRMYVGTLKDDTGTYVLNDGSNKTVPYGAWVK